MDEKLRSTLIATGSFIAAGAVWELLGHSAIYPPHLFPPPSRAAVALMEMARSGELSVDLKASGFRWGWGMLIGTLAGIAAGLSTGRLRAAHDSAGNLMNFLRAVPNVVMIPLAMLWFGFGDKEKVFMVAWGAFFPVWLNTQAGAQRLPREYLWAARSLGVSGIRIFSDVLLPSCLPFIVTGTRIGIATSIFALTAAEMTGAFEGLSYRVFYAYQNFQTDKMMAGILVLGLLSFAIDRLFVLAVHALLPWYSEEPETDA